MALAIVPAAAQAQVLYGSVIVDVRDDSGAAVPGADVTLVQQETNWTRSGVSADNGAATFATVPPGTYKITVTLTGFKESVTNGVNVLQNDVTRVSTMLVVGAMTDAITVTAEAEVLQTDRADVRAEIPSQQLSNLPVPVGRNYQNLFILIPGVSPPQNMHSVAVNPSRGLVFSSGGTTQNANAIRIEGAISNNLWLPHVAAYIPALEAIDTVSVVTNSFDADEGLSGGMSANVRIKSGTNQFHGSAFGYHYDEGMKARPYFLPSGTEKPKTRQNQWGGTFGGPIKQNTAFFFGSYETTDDEQVATRFGTVPTAAMRRGDFSASPTPIYDPLTGAADGSGRTAFAGNIIPSSRLDPTVQKLLAGLPMPTNGNLSDNYFASAPFTFTRHKVDAKVNVNPTSKLTFSGRLGWINHKFDSPPMFGDLGGLPVSEASGKQGIGTGNTISITGSGSYLATPTFIIDMYTGGTIIKTSSLPYRTGENLGTDFLGLRGTNGGGELYSGWPQFAVTSFSPIGSSGGNGTPFIDDNWQYQWTTNATWTHGRHVIKFGGDIVRQALNRFETGSPSGTFNFVGGTTTVRGGASANAVQQLRVLRARAAVDGVARHHSVRGQFQPQPQLAVQHVRERPVAGVEQAHGVARDAVGLLPDGHAHDARPRTLRLRQQRDADLRRRIDADRLRLRHGQGQFLAPPRRGLSRDRQDGDPRRLRHQLRSVSARVRAQHPRQLSLVDQSVADVAERVLVREPAG